MLMSLNYDVIDARKMAEVLAVILFHIWHNMKLMMPIPMAIYPSPRAINIGLYMPIIPKAAFVMHLPLAIQMNIILTK